MPSTRDQTTRDYVITTPRQSALSKSPLWAEQITPAEYRDDHTRGHPVLRTRGGNPPPKSAFVLLQMFPPPDNTPAHRVHPPGQFGRCCSTDENPSPTISYGRLDPRHHRYSHGCPTPQISSRGAIGTEKPPPYANAPRRSG